MSIINRYSKSTIWSIPYLIKQKIEESSLKNPVTELDKCVYPANKKWEVGRPGCLGRGILLAVTTPIIVIAAAVDAVASAAFTLVALTATILTLGKWRFAKTELVKNVVSTIACVFIAPAHILMTITAFLGVLHPNIYKYTFNYLTNPELVRIMAYQAGKDAFPTSNKTTLN